MTDHQKQFIAEFCRKNDILPDQLLQLKIGQQFELKKVYNRLREIVPYFTRLSFVEFEVIIENTDIFELTEINNIKYLKRVKDL